MDNENTEATEDLSFQEAAVRTGLSEKTLRKRIEAGEILGWKELQGGREVWRVRVPVSRNEEAEDAAGTPGSILVPVSPEYRDLLLRHETACMQLGRLQAATEHLPSLEAGISEQTQKALSAVQDANLVREERDRLRGRVRVLAAVAAVLAVLSSSVIGLLIRCWVS